MKTVSDWEVDRAKANAAFDRAAKAGYADGIRDAAAKIRVADEAIRELTEGEATDV